MPEPPSVPSPDRQALPVWFQERVEARLRILYPAYQVAATLGRLCRLVAEHRRQYPPRQRERWNQEDTILITYGSSIQDQEGRHLETLNRFLVQQLTGTVNSVHLLPIFPYSSDDGFAVIDYREVDAGLGDWQDVEHIGRDFNLMLDLVINHCSRENLWFIDFINNVAPGKDWFIELDPGTDVSQVVRPRTSPLLVPVHTHCCVKHVWATFSEDQIDLNFANPEVLLEFISIFLFYVARGARFIRLDAIAYLWKQLGTRCIHLRQTHEVVKLLRDIIEAAAPHCVLITETNVPNGENISYFGNSDEAHMVYQFSLPPLLLHALYRGDASRLTRWAQDYPRAPRDCTYLNFTASHDGIGLRPLEGILDPEEIDELVGAMREYGGYVTMRSHADGSETPYEINITYFDALKGTWRGEDELQVPRFLCAQTVMLALQGIPAVYIHSLTATPNDYTGVEHSGRTRSINRHRWRLEELERLLQEPGSPQALVFDELRRRLRIRRQQPAFHPESDQQTLDLGSDLFALWRSTKFQRILAVSNMTERVVSVDLPAHPCDGPGALWRDLIGARDYPSGVGHIVLVPYQSLWLEPRREGGGHPQ
ncbi:MAG TPA: alpha-amylase [Sedimenticola sp.]|nr:alpha-amylase [Sedimenticola sp.]